MKSTFHKLKLKATFYRNFKNFFERWFNEYLFTKLLKENISKCSEFLKICLNAVDNLTETKKKYSQGNNIPLMNNNLTKAQMKSII